MEELFDYELVDGIRYNMNFLNEIGKNFGFQ